MEFQIAAAVILLAFYGCYFTKMFRQRRKGIRTDQLGRGKTGVAKWTEVAVKAVSWTVLLTEAASIVGNVSALPAPMRILGAVLGGAGTALFILSVVTMRDSWRAGVSKTDKTPLVTRGIYQISRNPAFLGFDLVYLGIALMFFNKPLFVLSCLAALLFHLQIVNVEEEHLLEAFGEEYLQYKKKVFRYLGRRP